MNPPISELIQSTHMSFWIEYDVVFIEITELKKKPDFQLISILDFFVNWAL